MIFRRKADGFEFQSEYPSALKKGKYFDVCLNVLTAYIWISAEVSVGYLGRTLHYYHIAFIFCPGVKLMAFF
jgi:hypothetical protein